MNMPIDDARLIVLCGKVRDETILPEELVVFEKTLLGNPCALQTYRRFMSVCSGLEQVAKIPASPVVGLSDDNFDWASEASATSAAIGSRCESAPQISNATVRTSKKRLITISFGVTAIAAIVLFVVTRRDFHEPGTPTRIASLVESHQAVWSDGSVIHDGAQVPVGWHSLTSGAVRLRYQNNAELLVQAPAVFSIDNPMMASLQSGSLDLHVPSGATGFRIATPWASVVDHGTRIGVFVSEERVTEIHVFEGTAAAIHNRGRQGVLLGAGEAVTLATPDAEFVSTKAMRTHFAPSVDQIRTLPTIAGDIQLRVSPPRSVRRISSELVDLGRATVFPERASVELLEDLPVTCSAPGKPATLQSNDATLRASNRVDTFLVHLAVPKSARRTKKSVFSAGSLSFDRPVLGIVSAGPGKLPDQFVSPDTDYPADKYTGLEDTIAGQPGFADSLQLSSDRKTITFRLHVHGRDAAAQEDFVDQFRIFVKAAR
ncbi:MAG: hypothetical protein WBD31_12355 [Rubripirellula sp.]